MVCYKLVGRERQVCSRVNADCLTIYRKMGVWSSMDWDSNFTHAGCHSYAKEEASAVVRSLEEMNSSVKT